MPSQKANRLGQRSGAHCWLCLIVPCSTCVAVDLLCLVVGPVGPRLSVLTAAVAAAAAAAAAAVAAAAAAAAAEAAADAAAAAAKTIAAAAA